jgi:serine phosphatase RsbU (regulator of sigma subunit)
LNKGDTFYIFSDGYADQFGGEQGKKLSTRKFKEILLNIQNKSMLEQRTYLEGFVDSWKAEKEQLDDILIIGVRI